MNGPTSELEAFVFVDNGLILCSSEIPIVGRLKGSVDSDKQFVKVVL